MSLQSMLDDARSGTVDVESGWGQGRATYGGLVGALLLARMDELRAAEQDVEAPPQPLRSLTVNFVGPVVPGPAQIDAEILRAGSSATQARASVVQDGKVLAAALASFGRARTSSIDLTAQSLLPAMPRSSDVEAIPYVEGLTPEFYKHVQLRPTGGELPYTGSASSHITGWMSLDETPETFTEEHFVALADAWPPAVIQMLSEPKPASSLTWTLEMIESVTLADPETRWGYSVTTDAARDGYAHTDARIYSPDGYLVAISRQTISVFG